VLKLPRRLVVTTLCALTCVLLPAPPAMAQDGFDGLCPLFLQQERTELEDLELAVQLDETRLVVAEEIFFLLEGLWQNDLVGRLPYLSAKHRRDVAENGVELARRRIDRQQAAVEQYRLVCSAAPEHEQTSDDRRALEEAHQRYLDADCRVRTLDVTVFEIDLAATRGALPAVGASREVQRIDVNATGQVFPDTRARSLTLMSRRKAPASRPPRIQATDRSAPNSSAPPG